MSTFRTPLREAMERSRRFLGDSQRQESGPQGQSTLLDHVSIRERVRAEARFAKRHDLPTNAPSPLERLAILSGDDSGYAEMVQSRLEAMRGENSPGQSTQSRGRALSSYRCTSLGGGPRSR